MLNIVAEELPQGQRSMNGAITTQGRCFPGNNATSHLLAAQSKEPNGSCSRERGKPTALPFSFSLISSSEHQRFPSICLTQLLLSACCNSCQTQACRRWQSEREEADLNSTKSTCSCCSWFCCCCWD
jgi:hypothetical protein